MRPKKRRRKHGYYKQIKLYNRKCKLYKKHTGHEPGIFTKHMWIWLEGIKDPFWKGGVVYNEIS